MYFAQRITAATEGGADCSWHALYARHQHERVAADILSRKGFEVFLPMYSAVHRWKDRNKELSLPLFPCYFFVRGGLDRWLDVMRTPGVHHGVGWGGQVAVIPEEEIQAVRRMVESSLMVEPHPFLRCGDQVRVKSGPLEGIEGILLRKKNLFRLVLCVEMLQKAVAVEVDISMVERVARHDVRNPIPAAASVVTGQRSRAFAV